MAYQNPYLNYNSPYMPQYVQATPNPTMGGMNTVPKYEVIHVNGRNGADMFQMAPNSQVLLLDDTSPIVWLAQTDGAGYKTLTAFDISPHQEMQPVDIKSIEERLAKLEEKMNESNKSNNGNNKQYQNGKKPNDSNS